MTPQRCGGNWLGVKFGELQKGNSVTNTVNQKATNFIK